VHNIRIVSGRRICERLFRDVGSYNPIGFKSRMRSGSVVGDWCSIVTVQEVDVVFSLYTEGIQRTVEVILAFHGNVFFMKELMSNM